MSEHICRRYVITGLIVDDSLKIQKIVDFIMYSSKNTPSGAVAYKWGHILLQD